MSTVEYRFIEPLDVLFLRGNKLFGDPGSYGESLVPPWPSVVAGAIRSRMLADEGIDLAAFARGDQPHPALGTPEQPGVFAITVFHLARRNGDGAVELLMQPPADLVIIEVKEGEPHANFLVPTAFSQTDGLQSSAPFPLLPVLAERERSKPAGGYWLRQSGWVKYLAGTTPTMEDLVKSGELWSLDQRVGVGLDATTRRAADGRLFSMQAVAMRPGVGFLAAVSGAVPPRDGTLRLGGDSRAATVRVAPMAHPESDYNAIIKARRCRLVLTSPGIFTGGWIPNGISRNADGEYRFDLHGVKGRLVCAAVPRAEVVSGWDLAKGRPKSAQRAVPAGSVYWLDDLDAAEDVLRKLVAQGLWSVPCEDDARRAEGFNRFMLAAY